MGNLLGENAFGGLIPRAKATACKIRNYNLKKFKKAQQTPRPPAPEPGRPPDGLPPIPPEIPDPDPAPPPVENPGDMPVPPITDPDVVEPGESNPGHIPTRVFDEPQRLDEFAGLTLALAGSRRRDENSNLFPNPELESNTTVADAAIPSNEGDVKPRATQNDRPSQKWRIAMASIKPVEEATQDFSADLAALRDDVAKLTSSVSDFIHSHTAATTSTVVDAVDNARQKISDTASKAQDRVVGTSADIESTIERNPLAAVLIAMVAGLLVGLLSRGRK